MKKYIATIDGGEGGDTVIGAASADEALVDAIDWAKDGDWPEAGCKISVRVESEGDEDDWAEEDVEILSSDALRDSELLEDGEEIAMNEHEFTTERIIIMGDEAYYMHENGGTRGAHDRQCGDGVWRDYPVEPTREIDRREARRLMLDWGYAPQWVAKKTKNINA